MRNFVRFPMLMILGAAMAMAQSATTGAPTGAIPADLQAKVRTAIAQAKAAELDAIRAQQHAMALSSGVSNEISLAKAALELDNTWDFNPGYGDVKSVDYHALKFVKRGAPAAAPAPPSLPPAPPKSDPKDEPKK